MCIAVAQNNIRKIELYITSGLPLNLRDYDGRTPLHIAGSNGYKDLYNTLVKAGADTQIKDNFGNLPFLSDKDTLIEQPIKKEFRTSVNDTLLADDNSVSYYNFSYDNSF
jgi:ankyrin repeat protein